jgi:hypothetical protein
LTVIHDADLEYHPRDLLQMVPLFLMAKAPADTRTNAESQAATAHFWTAFFGLRSNLGGRPGGDGVFAAHVRPANGVFDLSQSYCSA